MQLTVFLLLFAAPAWLKLDRSKRDEIADRALKHAFPDETASIRFFDAEAFNAHYSDVAILEGATAEAVYFAMERLRDTELITQGYFLLKEIIPAFENGHRIFADAVTQ
tara:strand:+ start:8548 stop:8874 length:327 start_codon:yes stop_codon:yes gene_type:complete